MLLGMALTMAPEKALRMVQLMVVDLAEMKVQWTALMTVSTTAFAKASGMVPLTVTG